MMDKIPFNYNWLTPWGQRFVDIFLAVNHRTPEESN